MTNSVPKRLGKYKIIEEVGQGGFATVYKAVDTALGRTVALKVLREIASVPRFQREARVADSLDHPNIVTIYGVGQIEGDYFIAMEFLEGRSLSQILETEGPLPVSRVQVIIAEVASALDYAHARGFVHRDVKPSNIIVADDGRVTLTDFGLVKARKEATLTVEVKFLGTAEYTSPEQVKEEAVDARSDVYSLGVVLYAMLVGRPPFMADNPMVVMYKHVHALPPLEELPSDLSQGVVAVVEKALAKDPAARFQTVAEMAEALRWAVIEAPVSAEIAPPPLSKEAEVVRWPLVESVAVLKEKAVLFWQRVPLWAWGAVGGVVLLLVGGVLPGGGPVRILLASPTAMPIATSTSTATSRPTRTLTATPTDTLTSTAYPTYTPSPTNAPTVTPTFTPTPTPVPTPTTLPTPTVPPTPVSAPAVTGGQVCVSPIDGAEMVQVPAGEFIMGSSDGEVDYALQLCKGYLGDCQRDWLSGEQPPHAVYLDAFCIDKTEVTNTQYRKCVEAKACTVPRDTTYYDSADYAQHPVVHVDWYQASKYCQWAGKRLPTEAEWEKAARGTDRWVYPWGNDFDGSKLNFCDANCPEENKDASANDGCERTAPVGNYPAGASPCGALDMAGNAWEWVADWYWDDYYDRSPDRNPPGPDSGTYRVLRGGSWDNVPHLVRSANRGWRTPDYQSFSVGFRCVRGSE